MNFATLGYALFLMVVTVLYWLMPRRAGRLWLVFASLVFYASWNPVYVPGFLLVLTANWGLGLAAVRFRRPAVLFAVASSDDSPTHFSIRSSRTAFGSSRS